MFASDQWRPTRKGVHARRLVDYFFLFLLFFLGFQSDFGQLTRKNRIAYQRVLFYGTGPNDAIFVLVLSSLLVFWTLRNPASADLFTQISGHEHVPNIRRVFMFVNFGNSTCCALSVAIPLTLCQHK